MDSGQEFDISPFKYNSTTGEITKNGKCCGSKTRKGYLRIQHDGKRIMAHQLAWWLFYGAPAKAPLDHINGNRLDNRVANLKLSSPRENGLNKKSHRMGRLPGYSNRPYGKYKSEIRYSGSSVFLGDFDTKEQASTAYKRALNNILSGRHPLADEPKFEDHELYVYDDAKPLRKEE